MWSEQRWTVAVGGTALSVTAVSSSVREAGGRGKSRGNNAKRNALHQPTEVGGGMKNNSEKEMRWQATTDARIGGISL